MIVYHMSDTLKLNDALASDFKEQAELAEPFAQALEHGPECFFSVYLAGKYVRAVLRKFKLREWSNHAKWSVEGIFEYVRRREFPGMCSRLKGNYYFDNLEYAKTLYEVDWGGASQEEREQIRLYQVELDEEEPLKLDMRLYDAAFDAMREKDDLPAALDYARQYFSGGHTGEPIWEILSGKPAKAVKDLTHYLR